MSDKPTYPDLFEMGRASFEQFSKEFASYGLEADPVMELRKGTGMLCYYDFNDRHIYLSMPDFNAPTGKLQMLMFRQMLSAETNDELMRFLAIFIPFVVAHEMTHHFRHKYGLFTEDSWHEEQLANKMAAAVNKHRIPPDEREFAIMFLQRAMKKLADQLGIGESAFDSYYDIAHALQTSDHLSEVEMDNFRLAQSVAPVSSSATMMLRRSRNFSQEVNERLEKRRELISSFNETYADDQSRYIYYQVGWVFLAMKSTESGYVDEFAREYLNMRSQYLDIAMPQKFESRALYACYKASEQMKAKSEVISRYFYKRYRAFLLKYLERNYSAILRENADGQTVNFDILAVWDDRINDPLNFLASMVPSIMREIFPSRIGYSSTLAGINLPEDLPTPEDISIWEYAQTLQPGTVQTTVNLLQQFDKLDHFRTLPPENIIELGKKFNFVRYGPGETLVWQGENNSDVFVLLEGRLDTLIDGVRLDTSIQPGEVFGEIAWLTNSSRAATVRAAIPSTCLVIKGSDLQFLSYKNPTILMSIASTTARRLRQQR